MLEMKDISLENQRVLIRVDLNVPIKEGVILDDTRIRAIIPTLEFAVKSKAKVILLSHLGRPIEGEYNAKFSLLPVAQQLSKLLKRPVDFKTDWIGGISVTPGEIVLCENVRFNVGEEANDPVLAQKMANLCDVFVMDAFATAHRAQASTVGLAQFAPKAVAGPLLMAELKALKQALETAQKPRIAIVSGAKVSDKLKMLKNLMKKVDVLMLGGGIANTFLAAQGKFIGKSLFEPDLLEEAKALLKFAETKGVQIELPIDTVISDEKILDIGPKTIERYSAIIQQASTILWNGPLGVFEVEAFSRGTESIAKAIAASKAFSIAGGGETIMALEKYGVREKISYVSTGGGAFLAYLEGEILPAVTALELEGKNRVKTH